MTLHLRHRPKAFSTLVGQPFVTQYFTAALNKRLVNHAYLFKGARGTGKTSSARILAASLNCETGVTTTPCGQCTSCRQIANGSSLDVQEIDAASNNGVDFARELSFQLAYTSMGRYRIIIIDECHMLTTQAQNALLKPIEEPPANTIFILCTTDAHKVLDTIVSRCYPLTFKLVSSECVRDLLGRTIAAEGLTVSPAAVECLVTHSDGCLREALTLLGLVSVFDPVTEQHVIDAVGLLPVNYVQPLVKAVLHHEMFPVNAMVELFRQLVDKFDPMVLFGELVNQVKTQLENHLLSSGDCYGTQGRTLEVLEYLSDATGQLERLSSKNQAVWFEVLIMRLLLWEPEVATTPDPAPVQTPTPVPQPTPLSTPAPAIPEPTDARINELHKKLSNISRIAARAFPVESLTMDGKVTLPNVVAKIQARQHIQHLQSAYEQLGVNVTVEIV